MEMSSAQRVQNDKVRKAREHVFLREMERLADEMCRHYCTAAAVGTVDTKDLRGHIDQLQGRARDRLHQKMLSSQPESYGLGDRGVSADVPQLTPGTDQIPPLVEGFMGAQTLPVATNASVFESFREQTSSGVTNRLRQSRAPNIQPHPPPQRKTLLRAQDDEENVMRIQSFNMATLTDVGLNMDNNSKSFSVSHPKFVKLKTIPDQALRRGPPIPPIVPPVQSFVELTRTGAITERLHHVRTSSHGLGTVDVRGVSGATPRGTGRFTVVSPRPGQAGTAVTPRTVAARRAHEHTHHAMRGSLIKMRPCPPPEKF